MGFYHKLLKYHLGVVNTKKLSGVLPEFIYRQGEYADAMLDASRG